MFAENGEDVQLQAFNCEHGSKLSEGRINCAEVRKRRFQAMLVRRNGQKKKGNLSGPIKVCEENYSRTKKKKHSGCGWTARSSSRITLSKKIGKRAVVYDGWVLNQLRLTKLFGGNISVPRRDAVCFSS